MCPRQLHLEILFVSDLLPGGFPAARTLSSTQNKKTEQVFAKECPQKARDNLMHELKENKLFVLLQLSPSF